MNPVIQGGGNDLGVDGNYTLTADGIPLAGWTLNRSPELPSNPKPSECSIKSIKPLIVQNRVISLTILDDGKYNSRSWGYTDSRSPAVMGFELTKLGKSS